MERAAGSADRVLPNSSVEIGQDRCGTDCPTAGHELFRATNKIMEIGQVLVKGEYLLNFLAYVMETCQRFPSRRPLRYACV